MNIILILFLTIFLSSCEQTVENPDLPYKEQLVIRAVLEAGKIVEGIEITKTLPPLESYDYEKALIKDAVAVIKSGDSVYPLVFDAAYGRYYAANFIPEAGRKYFLEVKAGKMSATASTIIPFPVEIDTFYYKFSEQTTDWGEKSWQYNVYAEFKPYSGSVYLGFSFREEGFDIWTTDEIKRIQDTLKSGKIPLPVMHYWSYDSSYIKENIEEYTANIYSFDKQFYYYYITRWEGDPGDDIFGTSGVNIRGNINRGLGLFIGMATTRKKIDLK